MGNGSWCKRKKKERKRRKRSLCLLRRNLKQNIEDFLETDAGFVWVEVAGVRVCNCYFSTNDPFEIFETQILLLEESARESTGRSLIAGDLNSKSPDWGESHLDTRGILVGEMAARNDLIVLNQGRDFTFRRVAGGSIIDLTFAAPRPCLKDSRLVRPPSNYLE